MAVHWKAHMTEDGDDGEDSDGGVHSEDSEWYEDWVDYMQSCDGAMLLAIFNAATKELLERKRKQRVTVWLKDENTCAWKEDEYTCAD